MSTELEQEVQRLREALQISNQKLLEQAEQLGRLAGASIRVANDVVVMCEANLAGDIALVMSKVEQFTQTYQRNRKPIGGLH